MAICSAAAGLSSFHRASLGMFVLIISSVLLLQLSLVSCMPEDYYNPDYDEGSAPAFDAYGNWGDFTHDEDNGAVAADAIKRHLGALASKSSRPAFLGSRIHRNDVGFGGDDATFGRFVRGWNSPFGRFSKKTQSSNLEIPPMKHKRFLGSLARGGWFPRQFRGYVESQTPGQWEKRHVGAAAKIGWLKPLKSMKRDFFDGEYQGRFTDER